MASAAGTRLIVHADDFGIAEAVNRGVVDAFERGIVTSTSIMATGPAFEHAVALARAHPRLDVGVHLVLTEQRPLSAAGAALAGADGRFPKHAVRLVGRQLRGQVSLTAVRAELDAQIRRVRAAGLAVSHLDGHQHVHALPGIARVVMDLAAEHGIAAVRYPVERLRRYALAHLRYAPRLVEQLALQVASGLSPLWRARHCEQFVGFFFGGRLDEANLTTVLHALPARGTVELMCHPGHADMQGSRDWQYAWSAECAALTSPRIRELVAARGIELISYRDL